METKDKAAEETERLLPCFEDGVLVNEFGHLTEPCKRRPAVAAALRAAREIIAIVAARLPPPETLRAVTPDDALDVRRVALALTVREALAIHAAKW
jgi:hypothetical protein